MRVATPERSWGDRQTAGWVGGRRMVTSFNCMWAANRERMACISNEYVGGVIGLQSTGRARGQYDGAYCERRTDHHYVFDFLGRPRGR